MNKKHVLNVIQDLSEDLEDDEIVPTDAAINACLNLIEKVMESIPNGFKHYYPNITTSYSGDLHCDWLGEQRDLTSYISPKGEVTIQKKYIKNNTLGITTIKNPSDLDIFESVKWYYEERKMDENNTITDFEDKIDYLEDQCYSLHCANAENNDIIRKLSSKITLLENQLLSLKEEVKNITLRERRLR